MLVSIDKFYEVDFYNKCIQALLNNKVPVKQFISSTTLKWFLDVPYPPVMLNYELPQETEKRFMLSKTIAVFPSDQYLLYRRPNDYRFLNPKMVRADYMTNDNQYACFFHLKNQYDGHTLSKAVNSKIYYIGKYYNNRYRICVCLEPSIRPLLSSTDVLFEKTEKETWVKTETEINQRVFMLRDYLMKFTRTPYFSGNKFEAPPYYGEFQKRFFTF